MDFDTEVKMALYSYTAEAGRPPTLDETAHRIGARPGDVREAYARLAKSRLLLLEPDGVTIRMAPPFSGVPTPHVATVAGIEYFANCAWDALGIPAALHVSGEVRSRCAQTNEPYHLRVGVDGPEASDWLFHCAVPAAKWWQNLVYT